MSTPDYKAMGARIKEARKRNNMTQEMLAEACALSTAHIGHIERGTRIPSLETVYCISDVLSVSLDHLLFNTPEKIDKTLYVISENLKGKNPAKVKSFLAMIKALSDKIDEF